MRNTLENLILVVMIAINTLKDDHISTANTLVQRISGKVTYLFSNGSGCGGFNTNNNRNIGNMFWA